MIFRPGHQAQARDLAVQAHQVVNDLQLLIRIDFKVWVIKLGRQN